MTKREKMYQEIERHGNNIKTLFGVDGDAIKLCKQLRRLEVKAHKLATDYCNGENGVDSDNWDSLCAPILKSVAKILNPENADVEVFVNGDARGYALKIRFDDTDARRYEIYADWGGYGILAPDFNN